MKVFLVFALLMGSVWRLSVWRNQVGMTESVCGVLSLEKVKKGYLSPIKVRVSLFEGWNGTLESRSPEILWRGRWYGFNGIMVFPKNLRLDLPGKGKWEVQGKFECDLPSLNFSHVQDSFLKRGRRKIILKSGTSFWIESSEQNRWLNRIGTGFRKFLKRILSGYPGVGGWVWAVWTGDASGLDPKLVEMYREGGLLPVVALSGQHVSVLVVLARACLAAAGTGFLLGFDWFRKNHRHFDSLLPVLGSLILTCTSGATPSVLRTLVMALSMWLLRARRCDSTATQIVTSSAALLLVWDPSLVTGVSFVLSCGATLLLVEISQLDSLGGIIRKYVFLSFMMSILASPLILFYFAQWSYLSPVTSIALSWLWNLCLIPVGFLIPVLWFLPKESWYLVLNGLERGWFKLTEWQLGGNAWVAASFASYPRLTALETVLVQLVLLRFLQLFFRKQNSKIS